MHDSFLAEKIINSYNLRKELVETSYKSVNLYTFAYALVIRSISCGVWIYLYLIPYIYILTVSFGLPNGCKLHDVAILFHDPLLQRGNA